MSSLQLFHIFLHVDQHFNVVNAEIINNISILSMLRLVLRFDTTFPAVENTRFEVADDAGMHKNFLASLLRSGNFLGLVFQYSRVSESSGTTPSSQYKATSHLATVKEQFFSIGLVGLRP